MLIDNTDRLVTTVAALALVVVGGWGCSVAGTAADVAGAAVGEAAGDAIVRTYSPRFRTWYASYVTELAFSSGGYSVAPAAAEYEPGDSAVYRMLDAEGEVTGRMTRAFLFVDDEGNEAWKVKFQDDAADDTTTMELLFSPEREELLRMRARFPDEESAGEIPVEEGTYYRQPRTLTEESVEGATVGTETVSVPAGSFEADHVRYEVAGPAGGGYDWWLSDRVPGGIVRYAVQGRGSGGQGRPEDARGLSTSRYTLELVDYGTGAESELGLEP